MRIVTRPDFDGVVCAVLLHDVEEITEPVMWVEPGDVQKGLVEIRGNDIIANLPYDERCTLWFDHHYTNRIDSPFNGAYGEAPSAAGIIYKHYTGKFPKSRSELVAAADKIDSADLTMDEVQKPEEYDFVLLAMTISNHEEPDAPYWNRLVELLRRNTIDLVLNDAEVRQNCNRVITENKIYRELLNKYTRVREQVAITDFRGLKKAPTGNRFLVYSLYPEAHVHVRISQDARQPDRIAINVGHSIFNPGCRVNVGLLLSRYEGGGHPGAGACRFHVSKADEYIPRIIDALIRNDLLESS
jgi:oligoribonuclease NrnB/cAMP/cGMP phosphodiesterase (DHH superfamily)